MQYFCDPALFLPSLTLSRRLFSSFTAKPVVVEKKKKIPLAEKIRLKEEAKKEKMKQMAEVILKICFCLFLPGNSLMCFDQLKKGEI